MRLAVGGRLLAVGTTASGVRLTVELVKREPPVDLDSHDHVVEGSFEGRVGTVIVGECPDMAQVGEPPVGWLRARVSRTNCTRPLQLESSRTIRTGRSHPNRAVVGRTVAPVVLKKWMRSKA
jgi:hypothetical protein